LACGKVLWVLKFSENDRVALSLSAAKRFISCPTILINTAAVLIHLILAGARGAFESRRLMSDTAPPAPINAAQLK